MMRELIAKPLTLRRRRRRMPHAAFRRRRCAAASAAADADAPQAYAPIIFSFAADAASDFLLFRRFRQLRCFRYAAADAAFTPLLMPNFERRR